MITNLAAGVEAFTSNVFLVQGDRTVLVDPGANFDVVAAVRSHVDDIDAVVLTHTHRDHVGNLGSVKAAFDVEAWGFDPEADGVDHALADGDTVRLGNHDYDVFHTPGHKHDHCAFYSESAGVLFAGDLVFANGGFGRTDLEEGDRATLVDSIDAVLAAVDDDLGEMHCGHGPSATDDAYRHVTFAREIAGGQ